MVVNYNNNEQWVGIVEYWLQHHKQKTYLLQSQTAPNILNLAVMKTDVQEVQYIN